MNGEAPLRLQKSFDAMGSTYSVVLYGEDLQEMSQAIDAVFDEVDRLDRLLSNYRPESEWSLVNRFASEHPVRVSEELFRLVYDCLDYSRRSEGAFDITVGPLVKTWGFYKGDGRLPDASEASSAKSLVGYQHVHLDPEKMTVQFEIAGMGIDPGGIGKGYTVDRMAAILRARGFNTALLAASFSTIYGMGKPPSEPFGWRVRIRNPVRPRESVAEVFLNDMSLSTSGSSEKSFTAGGRTYSHLMNPRTGEPAQGALVAVLAPRNIDSEAWTKCCFVNGRNWAASHPVQGFRIFFFDNDDAGDNGWLP